MTPETLSTSWTFLEALKGPPGRFPELKGHPRQRRTPVPWRPSVVSTSKEGQIANSRSETPRSKARWGTPSGTVLTFREDSRARVG